MENNYYHCVNVIDSFSTWLACTFYQLSSATCLGYNYKNGTQFVIPIYPRMFFIKSDRSVRALTYRTIEMISIYFTHRLMKLIQLLYYHYRRDRKGPKRISYTL